MEYVPGHAKASLEVFHWEGMDTNKMLCSAVFSNGNKEGKWRP